MKISNDVIERAIKLAKNTMNENIGGPFGAAVIGPEGQILSIASNSVLGDHDPTAHAEINAIRKAGKVLGTHDLSGCVLYATGFPCPMCLSAIIWSNIKEVYFGTDLKDAENIGFRDDFIYKFINGGLKDESVMKIGQIGRDKCIELFNEYAAKEREIY